MAKQTSIASTLSAILTTLWVGGLWMTAITAYVLFQQLTDRSVAGAIAGKLFTLISLIGMFSGAWLLIQTLVRYGFSSLKLSLFWTVFAMWLLVLVGEFGIQPLLAQLKSSALPQDVMHSVFASRFKTWHGVASIAYVMECLLGVWLIVKGNQ